jgi:tetratricopeptide (TPR) repeat protein
MADPESPKGVWELIAAWLQSRFGKAGVIAVAVLGLAGGAYLKWNDILTLPGISYLHEVLTRDTIPQADTEKLSILVAHFTNDANDNVRNVVVEALAEYEAVQILPLDRTISPSGTSVDETERNGHNEARGYLEQSGATIVIWGQVLATGSKSIPKLYWTAVQGRVLRAERYEPMADQQLRLPDVFWVDLRQVLQLVIVSHSVTLDEQRRNTLPPKLPQFIATVRTLVDRERKKPTWPPEALDETALLLADALTKQGDLTNSAQSAQDAINLYSELLEKKYQSKNPLFWAKIQHNSGVARCILARVKKDAEQLQLAVSAFDFALTKWTRKSVASEWAKAQNSRGIALSMLGEMKTSIRTLEESIKAFNLALDVRTQQSTPLDWAATQNNLGNALGRKGKLESGTGTLLLAVSAYNRALEEWKPELVRVNWALVQHNLGNVYRMISAREHDPKRLDEALMAYRSALNVFTSAGTALYADFARNTIRETIGRPPLGSDVTN